MGGYHPQMATAVLETFPSTEPPKALAKSKLVSIKVSTGNESLTKPEETQLLNQSHDLAVEVDLLSSVDSLDPVNQVLCPNLGIVEYSFRSKLDCIFCDEKIQDDQRVKMMPCHHQFHSECLDQWLIRYNQFCPVCRAEVDQTHKPA
jgi:hypothetical protein